MHTPRIPLARVRVTGIAILAATTLTLTACGSSGSSGSAGGPTTSQQTTNQQSGSAQPSSQQTSSEDVSMPPASSRPSGDMLPPVSGEPTPNQLQSKSFESITIEGRDAASAPLVLDFPGGDTMGASAGCNSMGGRATFTDKTFTAGQLSSTMMACADKAIMDQEQWYADWLSKKLTWTFDNDTLVLSGAGVTVTYKIRGDVMAGPGGPGADASSAPGSGSGSTGVPAQSSGGGMIAPGEPVLAPRGVQSIVFQAVKITGRTMAGKPLKISFPSAGRMNADAGCNRLTGQVSFSADTMTISALASTEMYCTDADLREQEKWYLQWLETPLSWKLQDKKLILSGDGVTVTYRMDDVIRPAQEAPGVPTVHTLPPNTPAPPAKTSSPGHQLNPPPTTEK
ncbi:META domain-containing protein [Nakamurella aerolata]|uniref:META domain-containing protein n=1 Tax=Nakamurella aerolata TaxID=1656892 RepID=A0A849AGM7_9ACTN|nr:META domain-containing protein [Nakamurella aerolata]NNG35992.1 META domain-containing protein [Nakamurella aerolata]